MFRPITVCLLVCWLAGGFLPAKAAPFILYDDMGLARMKADYEQRKAGELSPAISSVAKNADGLLKTMPPSVTEKTVIPPSGDVHDYVSLAVYYWPDPAKPDGLPYINKDGVVNPEKDDLNKYDAKRLGRMVGAVNHLALAYYLTGREEYAAKAAEYLRTWFINPDTRMNPNLNFGQGVPGKEPGRPSGIIESRELIFVIDAINMLEASPSFTAADREGLRTWFKDYLNWLLTSPVGIKEGKTANNHSVWYDAQTAAFAWYTGQTGLAVRIVEEAKTKRVAVQVEPDGSMPRELARTRSMQYTMFNIEAFITLARVGDIVSVNLWDYETGDGRSVKKTIDYLAPYMTGEKEWTYQRIIAEKATGFARYLAMAEQRYRTGEYKKLIPLIAKDIKGRELIALESFK